MLYANILTQTLSSMCAEPSARSRTPQHNAQLTSEFTRAQLQTRLRHSLKLRLRPTLDLRRFFARLHLPAVARQACHTSMRRWLSAEHMQKASQHVQSAMVSSSVIYRTILRRELVEDEATCKGSRRPGRRRTRGRAGGCAHAEIPLQLLRPTSSTCGS